MHPILFRIGDFPIHTYGALIALGLVVGSALAGRLARRDGISPKDVQDALMWAVLGGFVGARLEYVRVNWSSFSGDLGRILNLREGGVVFYGALVGGLAVFIWQVRRRGLPLSATLDSIAPAMPLAHFFGRLGCFSAGCCFGRPTSVPWAVVFPSDPDGLAPQGVPIHPTQLYAAAYLLALVPLLLWVWHHRRFRGQAFLAYLTIYPVLRSINEFFRGDIQRGYFLESVLGRTVSNAQAISLVIVTIAVAGWVALGRRSSRSSPPPAATS